ncbi:SRPBCC domain-containing protein [Streptomyces sp. Tue6028]|uniref:SRPBCC domain-containing protein n=1 Tax=Streptomyces sp. Tue6028 TaxID=2036037 RepID=UPI003D70C706
MRFESQVGGRLIEMHDLKRDEGFEIGRVLIWEPGKRLVFAWRQSNGDASDSTDVEFRFEPVEGGTRVTVERGGWDRVLSAGPGGQTSPPGRK